MPPPDPAPSPPEPAPASEPDPPAPTPAPPDPRWRTVRLSVPLLWEFLPAKLRLWLLAAVVLSPLYLDLAERKGVHVPRSVGCASPVPAPTPGPIDPIDPPNPPGPPVPPAPKPAGPLRVLLVYESSASMTPNQINTLNSSVFRGFLNDRCAKDAAGRPEWRSWDKDIDVSNEDATWQALWAAAKPLIGSLSLPQVVVFRGQSGTAYPLPETADAAAKLIGDIVAAGGDK